MFHVVEVGDDTVIVHVDHSPMLISFTDSVGVAVLSYNVHSATPSAIVAFDGHERTIYIYSSHSSIVSVNPINRRSTCVAHGVNVTVHHVCV